MFLLKLEFWFLDYLTTDVQSLNTTNYTAVMVTQLYITAVDHRCVSPMFNDFAEKHLPPHLSLVLLPSFKCNQRLLANFIPSLTITVLTKVFLSPEYSKLTENTLSTGKIFFYAPEVLDKWSKAHHSFLLFQYSNLCDMIEKIRNCCPLKLHKVPAAPIIPQYYQRHPATRYN